MKIRGRVVKLRRVPAGSLLPSPKNRRRHPKSLSAEESTS